MNNIAIEKFVSDLTVYHELTFKQQQNVQKINSISKIFFSRAKMRNICLNDNIDQAIILDSGHQPNFLPYSGIWKKAFLLSWFQNQLEIKGKNSIAYFGFADQNLSTAKILSKNQIPYWNKKGSENIGFHIKETEKNKPFCTIQKPTLERWEKEMDKIARLYSGNVNKITSDRVQEKTKIEDIITILWDSYENSQNFSELNSIIFAKICYEILRIENIRFYTFSDLSREKIFLDESKQIILQQQAYNQIFNHTIAIKKLDLRTVTPNRIPFWYHCECGGKLDLIVTQPGIWIGSCHLCMKEHLLDVGSKLEGLDAFYAKMDFSAVSRNIVFASGMGSSLFLSGSGGSSSYGVISDEISQELGFYQPIRLSWISRDYYFGRFHTFAVKELMKTFNLAFSEISDGSFTKKIASRISDTGVSIIEAKERCECEKNLKQLENIRNNLVNVTLSAGHLFQGIPSFIDLLATLDAPVIVNGWREALGNAMVEFDGVAHKISKDVIYQTPFFHEATFEEIPTYYKMIESLEVS